MVAFYTMLKGQHGQWRAKDDEQSENKLGTMTVNVQDVMVM